MSRRRLGLDGTNVTVQHGLEALDHKAVLAMEVTAEGVDEQGPGAAGKRGGRLHGDVFVVLVNGGRALLRTAGCRKPLVHRSPYFSTASAR